MIINDKIAKLARKYAEDVEKAAEKYDDQHTEKLIHDMHNDSTSWKPLQDGIRNAFLAGANFVLGKQKKDAERSKKRRCLRDRTKACNMCHKCDIETDQWYSMSR